MLQFNKSIDTTVAFEVFYMYLVYNPDGIVLVRRYYIACLNLSELVVLEPSRTSLYLEGRMLDLRIDIEPMGCAAAERRAANRVRASWSGS